MQFTVMMQAFVKMDTEQFNAQGSLSHMGKHKL